MGGSIALVSSHPRLFLLYKGAEVVEKLLLVDASLVPGHHTFHHPLLLPVKVDGIDRMAKLGDPRAEPGGHGLLPQEAPQLVDLGHHGGQEERPTSRLVTTELPSWSYRRKMIWGFQGYMHFVG